jgi:hypothetical protein
LPVEVILELLSTAAERGFLIKAANGKAVDEVTRGVGDVIVEASPSATATLPIS